MVVNSIILWIECAFQGKNIHVWVDETRPRLQGARLTAWELHQASMIFILFVQNRDSISSNGWWSKWFVNVWIWISLRNRRTKKIDCVLFGADRVAANGDVANKIGTYNVSYCSHYDV